MIKKAHCNNRASKKAAAVAHTLFEKALTYIHCMECKRERKKKRVS